MCIYLFLFIALSLALSSHWDDSLDAFAICMQAILFLLPNYALTAPAYQNPLLTPFELLLPLPLPPPLSLSVPTLQSRKCQSKQNVSLQCEIRFPFKTVASFPLISFAIIFHFPQVFPTECACASAKATLKTIKKLSGLKCICNYVLASSGN